MDKNNIIPTSKELQMLRALRFMDHWKIQKKDSKTCTELTSFMSINDSNQLIKLGNIIAAICGMPKEAENLSIETISELESSAVSEIYGQWCIKTKYSYGSTIYFLKLFLGDEIYIPINMIFKTPKSILRFILSTRSTKINVNKLLLRNSLKEAIWGRPWPYWKQFQNNPNSTLTNCQIQHVMPILESWEANTIQPHIGPYTINHTLD